MARRIALGVVLALGLVVLLAWGLDGLLVYLVFAAVAAAVTYAAGSGGEWLERSSRGRFDDDRRRGGRGD